MRQIPGNPNLEPEAVASPEGLTNVSTWPDQGLGQGGERTGQKGHWAVRSLWWAPECPWGGMEMEKGEQGGQEDEQDPDDGEGRKCSQKSREELGPGGITPCTGLLLHFLTFPLKSCGIQLNELFRPITLSSLRTPSGASAEKPPWGTTM